MSHRNRQNRDGKRLAGRSARTGRRSRRSRSLTLEPMRRVVESAAGSNSAFEQTAESREHRRRAGPEDKEWTCPSHATANTLVEAKGSVSRQAIRMALGQLADYRRFADPDAKRAVLVPESPRPDLLALLDAEGVAAIWPVNDGFTDTDGGTFT